MGVILLYPILRLLWWVPGARNPESLGTYSFFGNLLDVMLFLMPGGFSTLEIDSIHFIQLPIAHTLV